MVWGSDIFSVWRPTNKTITVGFSPDNSECVNVTLRCWTFPTNINSNSGYLDYNTAHNVRDSKWIESTFEYLRRGPSERKIYPTVRLIYTDRYQNIKSGSGKYPLWYFWHSQACMQPSVPAPPLSAVSNEAEVDPMSPSYGFHSSDVIIITTKLRGRNDKTFCVLAPIPQANWYLVYSAVQ